MNYDILFAGVGGQGVLSVSAAISAAALDSGLSLKQSEVHGMSQRGGAVTAMLRLSDKTVHSPLISQGGASLLLSMEPLESLRYLPMLAPDAAFITAMSPVRNIGNYPEIEELYAKIRSIPGARLVDTEKLARSAGALRSANIVLVGAASPFLPLKPEALEKAIRELFKSKGEKVVEMNLLAFRLGREAAAQ